MPYYGKDFSFMAKQKCHRPKKLQIIDFKLIRNLMLETDDYGDSI